MEKLVFFFISIVLFVIYFLILKSAYNAFVPFNTTTDILAIFIVVIVIVPASIISANKVIIR